VRGAALLAAGLVPPLFAISRANLWGWGSTRTIGLIVLGLVVLAVFVLVERRTREPLVDIESLVAPPVLMTNVTTLLIGFGMFGSFILIPQLAETPAASGYGFGLDATAAGLLLLPGSVVMLFAGPVSGRSVRASAPRSRSPSAPWSRAWACCWWASSTTRRRS